MQDRYVGDVGDFVKYALLRALSAEARLGVAWYLHPDETGSADGRHVRYLQQPGEWRGLDEDLFDRLNGIVSAGQRCVAAIEEANLLPGAVFGGEPLAIADVPVRQRAAWRSGWFEAVGEQLDDCEIVFADPDNGLTTCDRFRPTTKRSAKSISEGEVRHLAQGGRPTVVYHHNTRRKGGHLAEIRFWQERLPGEVHAYYWRRWSNRTFFLLNGDRETTARLEGFAARWAQTKGCHIAPTQAPPP